MRLEDHTEEFTNQVKDWAVMGLVPRQIAERLGLEGEERHAFMIAIMTDKHPLHEAYITARQHGMEDADTALTPRSSPWPMPVTPTPWSCSTRCAGRIT